MNDIGIGSKGIVLRKTPAIRKTSGASVHAEPSSWSCNAPAETRSTFTDPLELEVPQASSPRSDAPRDELIRSKAPHSQFVVNKRLRSSPSVTGNHGIEGGSSKISDPIDTTNEDKDVKSVDKSPTNKEHEIHHVVPSKRLTSTGSLQRIQNLYNVSNPLDNMRQNSNQLREDSKQAKMSRDNRPLADRSTSAYTSPQAALGAIFSRLSGFFGRPAAVSWNTDDQDDDPEDEEQDDERQGDRDDNLEEDVSEDQADDMDEAREDETDGSTDDERDGQIERDDADEDDEEAATDGEVETNEHDDYGGGNLQDDGQDVAANGHISPVEVGPGDVESASPVDGDTTPSLTTPVNPSPTPERSLADDDSPNIRSKHKPLRLSPRRLPPVDTRAPRNSLFDLMERRHIPHRQDLDRVTITLDDPVPLRPPDYSVYTFGMDADLDNPSTLTPFDFSVYQVRMDIDLDNPPPFGPSVSFVSPEAMPDVPPLEIPK